MPRTGRPRQFDRDRALASAMHAFWRHGYEGASVERLRTAMGGLSPTSFYGAFGSKEALYREALALYAAMHGPVIAALRDEGLPPRERIEQAFRRVVAMQADPSHPVGCIVAMSATPGFVEDAELKALTAMERTENRAAIAACVRAGVARGDLPPGTNETGLATLLYTLLVGFSTQLADDVPAASLQEAITSALALWDHAGRTIESRERA